MGTATARRGPVGRTGAITDADTQILSDATWGGEAPREVPQERVKLPEQRVDEAQQIDRKLRDDCHEARIAEQRDNVRLELKSVQLRPASAHIVEVFYLLER